MTFGSQARSSEPVQLLDLVIPIIERSSEMCGRASCLTATDGAVIDDDYGSTCTCKQIRGGQPRDSCTYDANVGSQIVRNARKLGYVGGSHPYGSGAARVASHRFRFRWDYCKR